MYPHVIRKPSRPEYRVKVEILVVDYFLYVVLMCHLTFVHRVYQFSSIFLLVQRDGSQLLDQCEDRIGEQDFKRIVFL
jgi:hypothetical protein